LARPLDQELRGQLAQNLDRGSGAGHWTSWGQELACAVRLLKPRRSEARPR
jgi:hypothetical protein